MFGQAISFGKFRNAILEYYAINCKYGISVLEGGVNDY